MLKVSQRPSGELEIFYSLQGEGLNIGVPTVFLRLATCNLKCTWCDTKYTWDWDNYDYAEEVQSIDIGSIEQAIVGYGCKHLVITGGEPTMQAQRLVPLLGSLKQQGFFVEVETNGTIIPDEAFVPLVDQWNVSPKLANSGNPAKRREITAAYKFFSKMSNAYFKYVVEDPKDLEEITALAERYSISRGRTFLMPQATDPATLRDMSVWLVDLCKTKGFRFSTRLHVMLWGAERGV